MGNNILAASQLSRNDISCLAQVFENFFQHFHKPNHYSPCFNDYLKEIKTAVGLGFTAALVDDGLLTIYKGQLKVFLQCCERGEHQGQWTQLSQAIAEMVSLSLSIFAYLRYPRYFHDFSAALKKVLGSVSVQMELNKKTREVVERLLGMLVA